MNKKNTFKIVIAFVVVLALVLPSSAMFDNIGTTTNNEISSSDVDINNNIDLQTLDGVTIDNSIKELSDSDIDWWPMYRHDLENTGYSTTSSAPNTNNILWTYATGGHIYTSPAVVDGMVFFGSNDKNVYCLDESDGSLIWKYTTGDSVWSSPAVADGNVYIGSRDWNVYCLDASDGSLIWSYTTGDWVISSPAVADGRVYVGSNDHNVYCLDAMDGSLIWNYTTGNWIELSSPAVVDGKVYVGSNDHNVYCLDAMDGSLIWKTHNGQIRGPPVVVDGMVFFNGQSTSENYIHCLNAEDGSKIWSWTSGGAFVESFPAVAYGNVYVGCDDKNVYCLDSTDGSVIWKYTTGDVVWASPSVADGKLYVGCHDCSVYCLDAMDGSLIWKYTTDRLIYRSSPAIANGKMFIGSCDHNLYCFGLFQGHDVRIESIDTATGPFDIITPEVTVQNCGIYSETDVPVNLQITKIGTGNVEYDETVTINIDSEKNLVVTFPDWTPDDIGASISVQYRVTACTQLTTDENSANNYKSKMIALYPDDIDWWSMNRHDLNNTGFSTSTAPEGDLLWKYDDRESAKITFSSSVVADGKVYVGDMIGFHTRNIYCLDAYDGSLIWKFGVFRNINTAPAVADGMVYFTSEDRNLYCLNASDGSLIWIYDCGAALSSAAPTIVDGKIYIGSQCIDATDGSLIWKYEPNLFTSYTSPAVADGKVYIGSIYAGTFGDIFCLNATDGSLIWNYTMSKRIQFSSPAVADGKVYIGSWDHNLYCLDAMNGSLIWKYTTEDWVTSSPAVAYDKVFIGTHDGNLYCLNAQNGSLIWKYHLSSQHDETLLYSSPVVADGMVFIGSVWGDIYCLDVSDGSIIWEYSIYPQNVVHMSDPSIADGRLYVSGSGLHGYPMIWCFGSQSPNQPPYRPSDPDPPNHATNVDVDVDLSWTGGDPDGDPVTYDVYFGTTSPPPKVVSNQSGTTYDPDLDYETQYHWQIVAWDNHGASADGPIWQFTTGGEDTEPPVTTCDLDGIMEGGVYITDVTVTLTATDDMYGVNYTMYSVDRGEWYQYVDPFVVSEEGDHVVWFYSVDLAGNTEETKTESFTIQHPCPIEIDISGGLGVSAVITNTGEDDITDLEWSINITGGLLDRIDKQVSGIIPILAADDSVTIKSGIFLGLGPISITVIAGCAEETVDGKQFIIFTNVG